MKINIPVAIVASCVIIVGAVYFLWPKAGPVDQYAAEKQDIRALVMKFGEAIKKVSLSAPKEVLLQQIKDNYGPFSSADLIRAWGAEPIKAPGMTVPGMRLDKISILSTERDDDGSYTAEAEVVEVAEGGKSSTYGIAMKFRNQAGKWTITGFVKTSPY